MLRRVEWQLLTQVEAAYWACFRYRAHELRIGNDKVLLTRRSTCN